MPTRAPVVVVWLLVAAPLLASCGGVPQDRLAENNPPWPWDLAAAGERVPGQEVLDEIRPGGPPPDGIPPIDNPLFETIADGDAWLASHSPVMVLIQGEQARAYPLAILTYHEIVNDEIAGQPVLVTYCPLCNSALAFSRTLDGEVLSFGTSGRLWRSNLVMYDRGSRSLWSQFEGEAVVGTRHGDKLTALPVQLVAWRQFKADWPDGMVLSRETGHRRDYGRNPYTGYDSDDQPFLFSGETGGPLRPIARVVTAGGAQDPVAYPLSLLQARRVLHDRVKGKPLVVWWTAGTASALDESRIDSGKDVGSTGVFEREVDARVLTFAATDDGHFVDQETSSTWTVLGRAIDGPLRGTQLAAVPHDDTFWFVQFAFRPSSRIFTDER